MKGLLIEIRKERKKKQHKKTDNNSKIRLKRLMKRALLIIAIVISTIELLSAFVSCIDEHMNARTQQTLYSAGTRPMRRTMHMISSLCYACWLLYQFYCYTVQLA